MEKNNDENDIVLSNNDIADVDIGDNEDAEDEEMEVEEPVKKAKVLKLHLKT